MKFKCAQSRVKIPSKTLLFEVLTEVVKTDSLASNLTGVLERHLYLKLNIPIQLGGL